MAPQQRRGAHRGPCPGDGLEGHGEVAAGGIGLKAPSLPGTSGITDVGVTLTPGAVQGLSLSRGVAGRMGDVRGATGTLRVACAC
ncbi:MAG: hypothetical protein K6A65_00380 [Succinivibrionaceae bacterium]|nr:hypothetical protein [Succinivibrionaceae bacterium]